MWRPLLTSLPSRTVRWSAPAPSTPTASPKEAVDAVLESAAQAETPARAEVAAHWELRIENNKKLSVAASDSLLRGLSATPPLWDATSTHTQCDAASYRLRLPMSLPWSVVG